MQCTSLVRFAIYHLAGKFRWFRFHGIACQTFSRLLQPNEAPPIIINRTMRTNYVDEDPINTTHDCNVVICMQNLALMKATGPKRLPFI